MCTSLTQSLSQSLSLSHQALGMNGLTKSNRIVYNIVYNIISRDFEFSKILEFQLMSKSIQPNAGIWSETAFVGLFTDPYISGIGELERGHFSSSMQVRTL